MTSPLSFKGKVMGAAGAAMEILLKLLLIVILGYSFFVWFQAPPTPVLISYPSQIAQKTQPTLESMLIGNKETTNVFLATEEGLRRKNAVSIFTGAVLATDDKGELTTTVHFVSTGTIIVDAQANSTLVTAGKKGTRLVRDTSALLVTQKKDASRLFFTANETGSYILKINFPACNLTSNVTLMETPLNYLETRFAALNLPIQREIRLAPSEATLAVLDHEAFMRIALVDVLLKESHFLSAPFFGEKQMHFSPRYWDDETLVFSVADEDKWGTVLYHIFEDRYELLSEHFSDASYLSTEGELVLVQSSYGSGAVNVPFGSLALLERNKRILTKDIEAFAGANAKWLELFEDPTAHFLSFRKDLTADDFTRIADAGIRSRLLAVWQDFRLQTGEIPRGTVRIFRMIKNKQPQAVGSAAFTVQLSRGHHLYRENLFPLLVALRIPRDLIFDYEIRRLQAEAKHLPYVLLDTYNAL